MHHPKGNDNMQIDFMNEDFVRNPFPVYKYMRENESISRFFLPNGVPAWLVTRYKDAAEILNDSRFVTNFKNNEKQNLPLHREIVSQNLLSVEPSDHRRLRRLVQKAFTPRMVENLRGRIEDITNELLDKVQYKKEMKLIEDFAFPLPIHVICEMLGVPTEDQDMFKRWSNIIMDSAMHPTEQADEGLKSFIDYLQVLIRKKRSALQEDLISDLIRVEENGEVITEHEMYALVFVLILAGHETTVNLIGNGVVTLLEHPDQKEKLLNQPDLIHSALEEMLRYNGPVEVSNVRWATEDIEFSGKKFRKGDMIIISLASANRDEEIFENADTFDITRKINNHVAFGKGVHYCLGAPLARLEGEIAITTLFQRMPNLRLKTDLDLLKWRKSMIIRGLSEIPLLF
ncbi:cytochrome P450 [Bacillus zhangzhouensis]|nr:cytochrome P450 [Bacillus zhangzhouensis]